MGASRARVFRYLNRNQFIDYCFAAGLFNSLWFWPTFVPPVAFLKLNVEGSCWRRAQHQPDPRAACSAAGTSQHFAPIPVAVRDGPPEACGPEGLIGDNSAGLGMPAGDQEVLETKRRLAGLSFGHFTLLRADGPIGRLSRLGVCEALEAFLGSPGA